MIALLKNTEHIIEIKAMSKVVNNGRTDSTYFYVSGSEVSIHHPHWDISEQDQKADLAWFLKGYEYKFI